MLEMRSAKNGLITDTIVLTSLKMVPFFPHLAHQLGSLYQMFLYCFYDGFVILLSSLQYFQVFQLYLYWECTCECNRTIMPRCTCGGESTALWKWFTPSTFGWVLQIELISLGFCSKWLLPIKPSFWPLNDYIEINSRFMIFIFLKLDFRNTFTLKKYEGLVQISPFFLSTFLSLMVWILNVLSTESMYLGLGPSYWEL